MFSPPNFRPILCLATIPSCRILGNTRGTDNNSRDLHPRDWLNIVMPGALSWQWIREGFQFDKLPIFTRLRRQNRPLILPATQAVFQVSRTKSTRLDLKFFRVLSKKDTPECFIVPCFTINLSFIEGASPLPIAKCLKLL